MPKTKLFCGKSRRFTGNQYTGPIAKPVCTIHGQANGSPASSKTRSKTHPAVGESALSGFKLRNIKKGYVFKLTPGEVAKRTFQLKYCSASDKYIRVSDDNRQTTDYRSCLHMSQNIYRKEEHDWNMVYLARDRGDKPGHVGWRFDFKGSGLVVDTVTIVATSKTYQEGKVAWRLFSNDGKASKDLPLNEEIRAVSMGSLFTGQDNLNLHADLSGGIGSVAYQHAQLFRVGLEDYDVHPLDVEIRLTAE